MIPNHPDANPTAAPCVMVIFGASGDLTKRKLLPALCNLAQDNLLPKQFAIVGFATNDYTTESFRKMLGEEIPKYAPAPVDLKFWDGIAERIYYVRGDFQDTDAYKRLKEQIEQADKLHNALGNRFFYLAVAPRFFSLIVKKLGECGLTKEESDRWARVIVEKPFGHDLESAKQLNQDLKQVLTERQIYRIDHYLGKETVQNVMVFRFSNNIIEPLWNRNYVDHVQITAAETVGVEHRGGFYETAGALRDMVPNHLFQLLTMTAMEPPISFDADQVRNKQAEVLHAIQPLNPEDVLKNMVRGQYGAGTVDGQRVRGYRSEPDVAPDSNTETFVALKLQIDNWRWASVPFYLRTGKRLAQRTTEIVIQFRRTPFVLFRNTTVKKSRNQPPGHPYSARGRHFPELRRKGSGLGHEARPGEYGFRLLYLFRTGAQHRLRAAAARLHGGRCHALPAVGHGRSRMECDSAHSGRLARFARPRFPELCGRLVGAYRG